MTMASFNHGGRTNLEASRATRWKETGLLTEPVEQSPLPSLDYPPTPGHGRETNPHPVPASALRVSWLQIHYDVTNQVCMREGEKVGGEPSIWCLLPTSEIFSEPMTWPQHQNDDLFEDQKLFIALNGNRFCLCFIF